MAETALTPEQYRAKLSTEPLFWAQQATLNNPQQIAENATLQGVLDGYYTNPELLDAILNALPALSQDQVCQIFDAPIDVDAENTTTSDGALSAIQMQVERMKAAGNDFVESWAGLFPNSCNSLKTAYADFSGTPDSDTLPKQQEAVAVKRPCGCRKCRIMRNQDKMINVILGLSALILAIVLIKNWK